MCVCVYNDIKNEYDVQICLVVPLSQMEPGPVSCEHHDADFGMLGATAPSSVMTTL